MKYKIYAALKEDIGSGFVWLNNPHVKERPIICIENMANNKKVLCEGLKIEDNFKRIYKSHHTKNINDSKYPLIINDWYRKKLGIKSTQEEYELHITIKKCFIAKIRAMLQHPNVVVRTAICISIISVILGIIGVTLGIISFCD